MAGAVQGSEAHMTTGTFHGQLGAATAYYASIEPTAAAYHNSAEFARHVRAASVGAVPVTVFHREPGPVVVYANIGASLDAVLVGPRLPVGVVQVHDSSFYSALQPRPGAGRGVVLADLLPGGVGATYSGDYELHPRPGGGHGEAFVGLLPGGVDATYDNYGYYTLQPRPGARHGEELVDLLPDGAGHGEAFAGLLPGDVDTTYDNYGYYTLQSRPGARHGEVLVDLLPDGVCALFVDSGNFPQLTVGDTERADGGVVRGRSLGAGYDGSGDLAGAAYNNLGMVGGYLRRVLAFIGIGACSAAVNGLAAGPGSPAVAFDQFVLLLGGLFLVILHVLRV